MQHSIFYYPYASFKEEQSPLLKAVALYFDKLYILDPLKASWDWIGPSRQDRHLIMLEEQEILVRVSPEEVLHKYEEAITDSIRADLQDPEFLQLCAVSGRAGRWTLALAKVPKEIRNDPDHQPLDKSMQRVMGDVSRELSPELGRYREDYAEYSEVYDEYVEGQTGRIEYRYADYPLPLGEAIMINHALYGSLLHTTATPLTDEPFHHQVLNLKIKRAIEFPEVRRILDDRVRQRQIKRDALAMAALTDLDLAVISPEMPLREILKFRDDHKDELQQARKELGWLAREIRDKPWTQDFTDELEHTSIPALHRILEENKKARDSWLKTERGKKALKAAGLAIGAAAASLSLVLSPSPLLPIAVTTGILGLLGDKAIPGFELALDWKKGKREISENGLHYLLKLKP
jgi:translation initiation factor IF-3